MVTFSTVILIILILSFSLSKFSKLSISYFIPTSIFLMTLWVFFLGLFGKLYLGAVSLIPITIFLLIISLKIEPNLRLKNLIAKNLNPSIIFFIVFSGWNYLHVANMQLFEWDEFTHWGPAIKSMFLFDVFGSESPIVLNNTSYPPGLAIVSYLVMKIGNVWDESYIFWAYQIIFISLLIPILGKFTYKKFVYLIISSVILVLNSLYFNNLFKTIYADPLLAVVFGYTLYLGTKRLTVSNSWAKLNFFTSIAFLILIKDFGIVLSLISLSVFMFNSIFTAKTGSKSWNEIGKKISLEIILALFSSFGLRFIWSLYLSSGNFSSSSNSAIADSDTYIAAIGNKDSTYVKDLFVGYLSVLNDLDISLRGGLAFNTWQWLLLITGLVLVISFDQKNKKSKYFELSISTILILGGIGFLFALFLVYLNIFGNTFTSYQRYVSAFFGGAIFYIAGRTVDHLFRMSNVIEGDSQKTKSKVPLIIPVMMLSLIIHSPTGFALDYYFSPNQQSDLIRRNFEPIKQKIKLAQFDEKVRVGIIAQHTIGFEYYVIQYEAMPASVYQNGYYMWSIGSPSGPEDVWTNQDITPELWNDYLSNIDYLIVNNASVSFVQEFGDFFENTEFLFKEPAIYFVDHSGSRNKLIFFI